MYTPIVYTDRKIPKKKRLIMLLITIPSYRQPKQLARALQGLANQTYKDFSVIIIDDNSGIDLTQIVQTYSAFFPITIEKNITNLGAMNNLFKSITYKTEAKYILSHHEDDYLKANYLELAIKALEENSDTAFALTCAEWILEHDNYMDTTVAEPKFTKYSKKEFLTAVLENEQFIFGSVVYRISYIFGNFNLHDYHVLCDRIFLAELLNKDRKAVFLSSPGIFVQDHSAEEKNPRSNGMTLTHIINYYHYYKKELDSLKNKDKLITNSFLLSCSCYWKKLSLKEIWSSQKKYHLIKISKLNYIGLYSLFKIIIK
jgi:glycosyltransferase involved in cell wall biosynthesis